jgi:hypothetical protein
MKNTIKLTALIATLFLTACDNVVSKTFGGKMTVELQKDQKLVNASWKSDGDLSSLWLLTRVRKAEEQPETYQYIEKSTFGMLEGTVTIIEK